MNTEIFHPEELRETAKLGLPAPRLQLTWFHLPNKEEWNPFTRSYWTLRVRRCVYSIVIPLGEYDCRTEDDEGEMGVYRERHAQLGATTSEGTSWEELTPEMREHFDLETPFRDGAHAHWDSEALGGLPIYVVSGTKARKLEPVKGKEAP